MWNGQQYNRYLHMLMHSVILLHNNIVKLQLTRTHSIVEGPSILISNLVGRALSLELVVPELSHSDIASYWHIVNYHFTDIYKHA
jgi:hypothetical protein